MDSTAPSIWEKIDLDEYVAAQAATKAPLANDEPEGPKTRWQRTKQRAYWWTLKAAGVAFWTYVPVKLFVGDVDRWIINNVAPSLRWALDYRFFVFLVLLSTALLVFRRWVYLGAVAYVLFFPPLVLCFYLPRLLARHRTWLPTLGLLHLAWLTFRSIRFSVVTGTMFALSALVIALNGPPGLQVAAIAALLALWAVLLVRACVSAVRPVSFIQAQQRTISRVLGSKLVQGIAAPAPIHMKPEIVKLSKAQVDQVVMNASVGVCLYASGHYVAENLERYRKSGAPVVFSVIGIGILFAQAISIFSLANQGLFNVSHSQFSAADPSFATFVRYSLNSMFPGDINAIQPSGDAATWISTYAGISVGIILLTLTLALVFSVRSTREDLAAEDAIREMRVTSDQYATRLVTEYRLPLAELIGRLVDMGGLVNLWFRFVSENIGEFRRDASEEAS